MELDSFLAELGINDTEIPNTTTVTTESIDSLLDSLNDLQQTIDTVSAEIHNDVSVDTVTVDTEEVDRPIEETQDTTNNEPTLKTIDIYNEDSSRFSGAEWFNAVENTNNAIIGLGGIGSWLALLLSRLKVRTLYIRDMDTVEEANLAGQLYNNDSIGMFKTDAIRNIISNFNAHRPFIYSENREFTVNSTLHLPLFSTNPTNIFLALDSITARRNVYNWWKNNQTDTPTILIDGRLTADKWQIFAIPSNDTERMKVYEEEWLFPESEAQHLPCSFKQTTYMAAMIASCMCNLFINFVAESIKPIVPYSVPFMTEFDAQTLTMTTHECK